MSLNKKFEDLADFDNTGLDDNYVIIYDQTTDTFKTIDVDTLLSKSVVDDLLPDDFIDTVASNVVRDGGEGFG